MSWVSIQHIIPIQVLRCGDLDLPDNAIQSGFENRFDTELEVTCGSSTWISPGNITQRSKCVLDEDNPCSAHWTPLVACVGQFYFFIVLTLIKFL